MSSAVAQYVQASAHLAAPKATLPRNARAADAARAQKAPLVVSFVGDAPWPNPTVYCDAGVRYDWQFAAGLDVLIATRPGIDIRHAASALLKVADVIRGSYPTLLDVERKEAACIVHSTSADPFHLWPIRRGSSLWQQYFTP